MFSRIGLMVVTALALTIPSARAGGRWDVAFNGGWIRCLLDIDAQNQSVTAKIYDVSKMGNNGVMIDNVVVIDRGANYLLQGTITQGTLKIGMGNVQYTAGDRFYLWVAKYTDDIMLLFVHDASTYWHARLSWF